MSREPPMDPTRRAFLLKMARGAAYAAPVVVTLAAPGHLIAQGSSGVSQKGGMGTGMTGGGMGMGAPSIISDFSTDVGPSAPWSVPPPGGSGPPGGPSGSN